MAESEAKPVLPQARPSWSTNTSKANMLVLVAVELSPRFGLFISHKPETTIILMSAMNMLIHTVERYLYKKKWLDEDVA